MVDQDDFYDISKMRPEFSEKFKEFAKLLFSPERIVSKSQLGKYLTGNSLKEKLKSWCIELQRLTALSEGIKNKRILPEELVYYQAIQSDQ